MEIDPDPHNEVKKLQDLVKKLELQNEALRTKHQQNGDSENDENYGLRNIRNDSPQTQTLSDFENVDYRSLSSESMIWLRSSTALSSSVSEDDLLSWTRKDIDSPDAETALMRREIRNKIDELERMSRSSSSPLVGAHPVTSKSTSSLSRLNDETDSHSPGQSRTGYSTPPQKIPAVSSGTFTRIRRPPGGGPMLGEGDQPSLLGRSMEGSFYDAADISDIENLAKQQEANLRQNLTPANRKALGPKQALYDSENSARLSPSRFDSVDSVEGPEDFLQRRPLNSSDSSLERYSVTSSNNSDDGTNNVRHHHTARLAPEAHRSGPTGSMPPPKNYRNAQQPRRMVAPSGLAKPGFRGPSPVSRGANPVVAAPPQQQRGMSPQRSSGLPQPRRQIMKPGSIARSSLPTFRRSNLPAPKSAMQTGASQENWRDGCF